ARYVESSFRQIGYEPAALWFTNRYYKLPDMPVRNIEVTVPGTTRPQEIVVIGAHYDSVRGAPGANDNGTGVAAVLELARMFKDVKPARTVRFVMFVNEEPPFF